MPAPGRDLIPLSNRDLLPLSCLIIGVGAGFLLSKLTSRAPAAVSTISGEDAQIDPLHDFDEERAAQLRSRIPRTFNKRFKRPSDNYVYRVALTGGPCGGKSSALKSFTTALTNNGFDVYIQPEVATLLLNGGFHVSPEDRSCMYYFERAIMFCQLTMEKSFVAFAKRTGRPSVLITDRGLMDPRAYLTEEEWKRMLKEENWSEEDFLKRYDAVIHMVTAAEGAKESYTLENNQARMEAPEEAIDIDMKLRECWKSHPSHHVVHCNDSFEAKVQVATQTLLEVVKGKADSGEVNNMDSAVLVLQPGETAGSMI